MVFGCGGDRDAGKRPLMGEIAARLADVAIVTDDNPRSEDAGRDPRRGPGRRAAAPGDRRPRARRSGRPFDGLAPGDMLVVAGKGHEKGQIVGDGVLPFDDARGPRAAARDGEGPRA